MSDFIFQDISVVDISWNQFHDDSLTLAKKLKPLGPFKAICAVTRGGLIPAGIIAYELGIKLIDTLCIESYEDKAQGTVNLLKPISEEVMAVTGNHGSNLLIIDDLVDTGQTFQYISRSFYNATYATLYAKPKGFDCVHECVRTYDQHDWIYFPWDKA